MVDTSHDCEHSGVVAKLNRDTAKLEPGGRIHVHAKASSSCCSATLAEGGTDEKGYTCTACGKPCTKVMGPKTARWTCLCGQPRQQAVTEPEDAP